MWLLIVGIILLMLSSFWHTYYVIGKLASPMYKPAFFFLSDIISLFLRLGWFLLFLVGIVLVFLYDWIIGLIAIPAYWFLLPMLFVRSLRKWMLPSWDELSDTMKDFIKQTGYDEHNYLDSYWWRADADQKFTEDWLSKMRKGE